MWDKTRLQELAKAKLTDYQFIVVSNREPYIHRFSGDEIECAVPASGMATALDPVMQACGGTWIAHGSGDADREVVDAHDRIAVPPDNPAYTLRRVWLTKEEEDGHYYGFANEALWPLCHIAYTRPTFNEADWRMYQQVNQRFADVVLEEIGERRAFVFVQDYHFALLPRILKAANPNLIVAQFWHIPWPNREAFRVCPWSEAILDGLLGNDLLGFHIRYHCNNFMDTVDRGIEAKVDYEHFAITRGGHTTLVRPFPISIDFERIATASQSAAIDQEIRRIKRRWNLKTPFVGVGVDRIDYTKGIPERLRAIERLFERYPEYHRRFTFLQIGVPSRVHIKQYQALNDEIEALIETINWKHQDSSWKPIVFIHEHCAPPVLWAAYRLANVCVVSSLHDGMNLVAKEFVATRADEDGVLILSPFTGSARELHTGALLVNPYAVDQMTEQMHQALTMAPEERRRRMQRLRAAVAEQNVYRWAGKILASLLRFEFQEEEKIPEPLA